MEIKRTVGERGRTLYVVGYVSTYNEQSAIDLTQTGVFKLADPLTLAATEKAAGHQMLEDVLAKMERAKFPRLGHGTGSDKFPWEG